MKRQLLTLTLTIFAVCSFGQTKEKYSFNKTESIDSTSIVIVSVGRETKFDFDSRATLLFIDTKDNKTYSLILTTPYRLTDHSANNTGKFKGEKFVVFRAKTTDTDKNGKLNWQDPDYLFLCDIYGQNIKKISADNFDVKSWTLNKTTNTITFVGTADTDNNGKYDKYDTDKVFIFDLNSETITEVYNADDKKK